MKIERPRGKLLKGPPGNSPDVKASILWHYTTGKNFQSIFKDGRILAATAGVPKREKPIVWFSSNGYWEQTAGKLLRMPDGTLMKLSMEHHTQKLCGGLVRIGVAPSTAPHDWPTLKRLSGMSSKVARSLWSAGINDGSHPSEWFGTFDPVPQEKWTAVQVFQVGAWEPVAVPWAVSAVHSSQGDRDEF
jgi:hypothetical protein